MTAFTHLSSYLSGKAERRAALSPPIRGETGFHAAPSMSWKTINAVLGLAAVDEIFCQELLKNPIEAIKQQKFVLTKEEEEKLSKIVARDLADFSQQLLMLFGRKE